MAVQAQYPSNFLLLDRAVQEGKSPLANDYSLQPQPGGGGSGGSGGGMISSFLDQTNMSFDHGGVNNSRKRGREQGTTTTIGRGGATMSRPMISMAPRMDLTQLRNNNVSIGLGLNFVDQQQQQQKQSSFSPQSSVLFSILSDDLSSHIKQQRDELEHFLLAHEEQLRRELSEKRQRHYRAILGAAEESVARKMKDKEMQVEKAMRRNAQLEAKATQLSLEAQAWQHRAKLQEQMAANLQAQLERAIIVTSGAPQVQERDECGGGGEAEDAESAYMDPDRVVETSGPMCKGCKKRAASVVILPCRHLSLCIECDAVSQAVCPVCLGFRSSSVEVFLS